MKVKVIFSKLLFPNGFQEDYVNQTTLSQRLQVSIPHAFNILDAHFAQLKIEKVCHELLPLGEISPISMYSMGNQFSKNEAIDSTQFLPQEYLTSFASSPKFPVQKQHHDRGMFHGHCN